jgi:Ca-activated chloride channel homolog
MKTFITLLLFILAVIYFGYDFIFDSGSSKTSSPAPVQQQQKAAPPSAKEIMEPSSMQQANSTWPFVDGGTDIGTLADSLTQKNIVMVFDGSGSMQKSGCSGDNTKIEVARQVVTAWADTVPEDANLGLIVFDHSGFSIRLPLGQKNRAQFRAEIAKVVADYKTPLTQSLSTAYQMLTEQGRKQLGYGEYTVVIVTDGAANDVVKLEQTVDYVLQKSPIMIYTIGFCINSDHTLNTKGRTVYRAANNPEELRQGLQDVLAESESFDISGFE